MLNKMGLQRRVVRSLLVTLLVILTSCILQPAAAATQPAKQKMVGKVLMTKGMVIAKRGATLTRKLRRRANFYQGETLVTAKKAIAQLRFSDGTLISMYPDTQLVLEKYNMSKTTKDNEFLGHLVKGGFRIITGKIAKRNPKDYKVSTRVATMAVLGTDFETATTVNKTDVFVHDGAVNVMATSCGTPGTDGRCVNPQIMSDNMEVPSGTGASVSEGQVVPTSEPGGLIQTTQADAEAIEQEAEASQDTQDNDPAVQSEDENSDAEVESNSESNNTVNDDATDSTSSEGGNVQSDNPDNTSLAVVAQEQEVTDNTQTKYFYTVDGDYTAHAAVLEENISQGAATQSNTGSATLAGGNTVSWGRWDTSGGSNTWTLNGSSQSGDVFWIKSTDFITPPTTGSGTYSVSIRDATGTLVGSGAATSFQAGSDSGSTFTANFGANTVSGSISFNMTEDGGAGVNTWTLDNISGTIGSGKFTAATVDTPNAVDGTTNITNFRMDGGFVGSNAAHVAGAIGATSASSGSVQAVFTGTK